MQAEYIPVVLGVLVGALGLALLADARLPDRADGVTSERRRRVRAERSRLGEAIVGAGTLCMAAALIGRDAWDYGNVVVILGAVLLGVGAALNWRYLRELFLFRGPARRAVEEEAAAAPTVATRPPAPPRPPAERTPLR